MSDTKTLTVEVREAFGSAASRRLRRSGQVPCVVYTGGNEPSAISIEREILEKAISSPHVIQLDIQGSVKNVLTQDVQWEYMTNTLVHVDFKEIRMDEKIQTAVPLVAIGDAVGVIKGGNLEQVMFEIEVECLPANLPEKIEVDISGLDIGDSILIGDLPMPEKVVAIFADETQTLVSIAAPRATEEEEDAAEAAASAAPAEEAAAE
jgi:large subunit ribosomal protein L25